MSKIWYPLRKEYPELNLKIEIDGNKIIFTGNKTPAELLGDVCLINYYCSDRRIYIQSASYPDIYDYENELSFYIGGTSENPNTFKCTYRLTDRTKYNIELLNKFFTKQPILNKQITIL
jgi:hypothetical protein